MHVDAPNRRENRRLDVAAHSLVGGPVIASPELRPRLFLLNAVKGQLSFWSMMYVVVECLKTVGLTRESAEFRTRAMELNQNDEDQTELLALATEYVDIV